jgi:hypothetical protein
MQYLIALDPQLNLSAAEFAAAWNAGEHVAAGTASVSEVPPESFLSPEVTVALIAAAAYIPTTVIANFISEYLKKKFIDKDKPKVTVTTISTPDGQPVLIIKQEANP